MRWLIKIYAVFEPPHQDLRCLQIQQFSSLALRELNFPSILRFCRILISDQPEVETLTMKLSQFRGKEAILECRVRANPHKNYSWNKNGKRLPDKPWKYKTEVCPQ